MKYLKPEIEEQEVTINVLYEDEIVVIYSNRKEVIQNLTEKIGKPTKKFIRGKTYWTGAEWRISFRDSDIINSILSKEVFIDKKIKLKKINNSINIEEKFQQISLDI